MLRINNQIIDIATPEMVLVQQGRRFTPASQNMISADVPRAVQGIPVDAVKRSLPIPCYTEFNAAKQRGSADGETWMRVGLLIVRQNRFRETFQLTEGTIVKFKRPIPGRERFWYKLETVESTPSTFAGQLTTISFELSELPNPMAGIA